MAHYSLLHNPPSQVRTGWMTVRLILERLQHLPTFPELKVVKWLEWELVLATSKLFRRSASPPPCSKSMCPGR